MQTPNFEADFTAPERRSQQAYGKVGPGQRLPLMIARPVDARNRTPTSTPNSLLSSKVHVSDGQEVDVWAVNIAYCQQWAPDSKDQ